MGTNKTLSIFKRQFKKRYYKYNYQKGISFPTELNHSYLVTTEIGIFHISLEHCKLITDKPGYGLAIANEDAIFSFETINIENPSILESRLVVVNKKDLLKGKYLKKNELKKAKVLYQQSFRSNNGRIHQINYNGFENDGGVATLTEENSILYFKKEKNIKKIYPFVDRFGSVIKDFDHNHINSAIFIDGIIYFVAYKAGDSSLIGFIQGGRVYGWRVFPRGYHDFYPTATGFITCDTFGKEEHGRIVTENGPFRPDYFQANSFCPRGVAGGDQELLIGHSHKGPRSKRFKGNGGLIIFKNKGKPRYVELPAAQIYQIVRDDGEHFISQQLCTHKGMVEILSQTFGTVVNIGPCLEEKF